MMNDLRSARNRPVLRRGWFLLLVRMLLVGCTTADGTADGSLANALATAAGDLATAFINAAAPVVVQLLETGFLSIIL